MKRIIATMALLLAPAAALLAQKDEEARPKFTPVEVVSTVEAAYPINSVAQGTVMLELTVDKQGELESVRVIQDVPSLTEPAKKAVKKWKFRPATYDGKPVAGKIVLSFSYRTIVFSGR